jgi:hypothetical protein
MGSMTSIRGAMPEASMIASSAASDVMIAGDLSLPVGGGVQVDEGGASAAVAHARHQRAQRCPVGAQGQDRGAVVVAAELHRCG